MKCREEALVTVRLEPGGTCLDMELPVFMPAGELSTKILETLRVMNPVAFSNISRTHISLKGSVMRGEETLASCGVWDGGTISLILLKEV